MTFEHGVKELWELATSCLEQECSRWKQRCVQRPWSQSICTLTCWMGPRGREAGGGPAKSSESSGGVGGSRNLTTGGILGFKMGSQCRVLGGRGQALQCVLIYAQSGLCVDNRRLGWRMRVDQKIAEATRGSPL